MIYSAVWVAAALALGVVLVEIARAVRRGGREAPGTRAAWIAGLALLGVGAAVFLSGGLDVAGADLGGDLEFSSVVDSLGGDPAVTGSVIAGLLVALLVLGVLAPARSGMLLQRLGVAALPLMAALTILTVLLERGEWRDSTIGPFMAGLFFFALPAFLTGALLRHAGREAREEARGSRASHAT